jgi:hypothetical protein
MLTVLSAVSSVSNRSRLPSCGAGFYPTQSTRSGSALTLNPTRSQFLVPILDPPRYPAGFCQVSASFLICHYNPILYATMKYLSCDRIAIWSMWESCSFRRSFTSRCPICIPISIRWITVKLQQKSRGIQSDSTNIDRITNRRPGGEKASETASFTYGLYRDTIRTQILNLRESICCWTHWNPPGNGPGQGFHVVKPIATGPVWSLPSPGPGPAIWPCC